MITSQKLISNTGRMMLAYAGRKIITFLQFALIARFTSVEDTANYLFLMAFAGVIIAVLDFGLSPTLIREASKSIENLARYLNSILGIKLILSLSGALFGVLLVSVLDYPDITRQLVYLMILGVLLESFSETFYGCLRVHFRMKYEARGIIFGQCLSLGILALAVTLHWEMQIIVGSYLIAQLFNLLYSYFQLHHRLNLSPRISFEWKLIRKFVLIALPILIALLFERILGTDIFILNLMSDKRTVALFSVPALVISSLIFIPMAMSDVIYPAFSSYHVTSQEKLGRIFETSFRTLLYITFPLTFGIMILSRELLFIGFGEHYTDAAPILQILSLSLIPLFMVFPIRSLLNACNRQITNTALMILSAVIHLLLTYLLIPLYGAIGIAWASLVGNLCFFLCGMYFVYQIIGNYYVKVCMTDIAKVSLATFVTAVILIGMKNYLHVLIVVPLVGFFYFLCLFLVRGYSRSVFEFLREKRSL